MPKVILLQNKNNEQLFFHFNDIDDANKMDDLANTTLIHGESTLLVKWFDFKVRKKYKASMTLKTALKRGLMLIKRLIKKENLSEKSLNASGLESVVIHKKTIIIEAQFS